MIKIYLLKISLFSIFLIQTQYIKIKAQSCKVDTIYSSNLIYSSNVNFEKKPVYKTIITQSNNDLKIEYLSQIYVSHLKLYRNYLKQTSEFSPSFKTIITLRTSQTFDTISSSWINNTKDETSLNSKGKVVNQSYFNWNKINQSWRQTGNTTKNYLNDTLLTEEISQYYVPYINALRNNSKYTFTYDIKGNVLNEVYSEWDTVSVIFVNYRKQSYTYSSNNKVETETIDFWDKVNNRYNKHSKNEYLYTITDKLNIYTYKTWDPMTSTYLNNSRKIIMYNVNDFESVELNQNYDNGTSTWIDNYKYESDYHSNDLLKSKTSSNYNSGTMAWIPSYKENIDYNANGKKIKEYQYEWQNATSEWQEKNLVTNKYNAGDSILLHEYYQRNEAINGLEINSKIAYTYNYTNPIYTETRYRNYNNITGVFEDVILNEHQCRLANTNINTHPTINSMKIYPNPSNTGYIEMKADININYKIYGIDGKLLLYGTNLPHQRINVKSLKPGIYLFVSEQQTSKFIIE